MQELKHFLRILYIADTEDEEGVRTRKVSKIWNDYDSWQEVSYLSAVNVKERDEAE